jgi:hypothetical protein
VPSIGARCLESITHASDVCLRGSRIVQAATNPGSVHPWQLHSSLVDSEFLVSGDEEEEEGVSTEGEDEEEEEEGEGEGGGGVAARDRRNAPAPKGGGEKNTLKTSPSLGIFTLVRLVTSKPSAISLRRSVLLE